MHPLPRGRTTSGNLAALTLVSHSETSSELSLQQHLELSPDLVAYTSLAAEGTSEPLMMAQSVPHPATDKKRVKVYELRNNDWFDRGTGFCTATFGSVRLQLFWRLSRPLSMTSLTALPCRQKMAAKTPALLSRPRTTPSGYS